MICSLADETDGPDACQVKFLRWGLETTQDQSHPRAFKKFATCRKARVCKVFDSRSRPDSNGMLEPWLDNHMRSCKILAQIMRRQKISVSSALHSKHNAWAVHIARLRIGPRDRLSNLNLCWLGDARDGGMPKNYTMISTGSLLDVPQALASPEDWSSNFTQVGR